MILSFDVIFHCLICDIFWYLSLFSIIFDFCHFFTIFINFSTLSIFVYSYQLCLFTGHGFSSAPDKPKSYGFPKLLRDILTIFDHFIQRGREVVVIGHSYGCSMAAAVARSRPECVRLLVMCASGGPTPLCPPKQLSKVPPSLIACLKPFLKCRFGTSQKYEARGKASKIQESFDVPAYVLHHVLMGQLWPEGKF